LPEEIKYTAFIDLVTRISEESKNKVVSDAKKVGEEINRAAQQGQKATPIRKPVEQTANAYDKLNQSIVSHNRIITELQKLEGGEQLAQKERLSIIREITQARAKGVIQEGQFSNELNKTSEAYTNVAAASKKTLISVARWAVGWTAAYSVIRAGTNLIRTSVSDMLKLEEQIARAVSASRVERGGIMTAQQASQIRNIYTRELTSLLRDTSVSAQDAGTALYQLASAGLTANEAISALEPVLDLSVATFGDLEQGARLVSSVYRVFESQFTQFANKREAFTHISDVIVTAYNQEQIELSELSSALEYVANTAGKTEMSFEELIATIGFLGTGMLRGSRAGTDLMNFFSDVIKKADVVKEKLDITIDPDKPFSPVKFMEDLHKKAEENKVTLAVLFDIFGQRGRKGVMEILNRWKDWQMVIKQTNKEMEGATKRTKELVEESTIKKIAALHNAWDSFLMTLKNTASVFGVLDALQNYINNLSRGLEVINETRRVYKEFSELQPKDFLSRITGQRNVAQIRSYSKALANLNQQIREMKLEQGEEKHAELRAQMLLTSKFTKKSIIDKTDIYAILDTVQKEITARSKTKKIAIPITRPKFIAGETEEASTKAWEDSLVSLRNMLSEINNEIEIRNMLMQAYGIKEAFIISSNIEGMRIEIKLLEQQKKLASSPEQRQDINQEILKRRLDLAREETRLSIAGFNEQREAQQEYFEDIQSNYEIIYKRREADLQLEGAGEEKIIALEKEKLAVQMDYVSNRLVLLSLFDPFNESLRKELESQLKSLGLSKEEVDIKRKLAENEKAIADEQDAINRKQSIYNSLGYTGVDTARMMLDYLKEQNVIKGETLDKLREEYQLQLLSSQLEERRTMLQNDLSVKEEMVSGWSDISAFLGAVKREEMLNEELEIARELGDVQRENLLLDELKYIEYDKQKALLQDMRGIFSGIGDSIYEVMSGTKSLSDVWKEFNQTVLRKCLQTLAEMLIKMLLMKALGFIMGGVGGGSTGGGSSISAPSAAPAWNFQPSMIAAGGAVLPSSPSAIPVLAHPKEMVLPSDISDFIVRSAKTASGDTQRENKPITIVNMIQDDSIAASVARRQDVVLNIVGSDLSRNGITRRTIYRSL